MLIFNTTYKVSGSQNENWLNWIKEQHIPFMMSSGDFSKPQTTKIVGSEDNEGISYSVQFHIYDMTTLIQWHKEFATSFQNNCKAAFGEDVSFFSTVLEIVE